MMYIAKAVAYMVVGFIIAFIGVSNNLLVPTVFGLILTFLPTIDTLLRYLHE